MTFAIIVTLCSYSPVDAFKDALALHNSGRDSTPNSARGSCQSSGDAE